MKQIILFVSVICVSNNAFTQKYWTQSGHISFFSEAPLENIEANNNQVSSIIDVENGDIVFSLLMKAFLFEKALMQEHFNEKYVESDAYPKAQFKGSIVNVDRVQIDSAGIYPVSIHGELTIHGQTNPIEVEGQLTVTEDALIAGTAAFTIKLEDYDIKIPAAVKDNISKEIQIDVSMNYDLYAK